MKKPIRIFLADSYYWTRVNLLDEGKHNVDGTIIPVSFQIHHADVTAHIPDHVGVPVVPFAAQGGRSMSGLFVKKRLTFSGTVPRI
jgi:hypothetical protein